MWDLVPLAMRDFRGEKKKQRRRKERNLPEDSGGDDGLSNEKREDIGAKWIAIE